VPLGVHLLAKFRVSSFNDSRDTRGSQNSKIGSRVPLVTPLTNFFTFVVIPLGVHLRAKFRVPSFNRSQDMEGVPKFQKVRHMNPSQPNNNNNAHQVVVVKQHFKGNPGQSSPPDIYPRDNCPGHFSQDTHIRRFRYNMSVVRLTLTFKLTWTVAWPNPTLTRTLPNISPNANLSVVLGIEALFAVMKLNNYTFSVIATRYMSFLIDQRFITTALLMIKNSRNQCKNLLSL